MKVLYTNDKRFHNRLKIFKQTSVVLDKTTFDDLQALKTRINGHDEGMDVLDKTFHTFLEQTNKPFTKHL